MRVCDDGDGGETQVSPQTRHARVRPSSPAVPAVFAIAVSPDGRTPRHRGHHGHWESMWGRLVVTKDIDGYKEARPDAELPKTACRIEVPCRTV
jgi:hypothetical protein